MQINQTAHRFDVDQFRFRQIGRDVSLVLGVVKDVLPSRVCGVKVEQFLHRCGPGLDLLDPSGKHHLAELLDTRIFRLDTLQQRHGITHEQPHLASEREGDAPRRRVADFFPWLVARSAYQADWSIRCDEGAPIEANKCPGTGRKVGRQLDCGLDCVLDVRQVVESDWWSTGLSGLIPDSILLLRRRIEPEVLTDPTADVLATTGAHLHPNHGRSEVLGCPSGIRSAHALQGHVVGKGPPVLLGGRKLAVGKAPDSAEGLALDFAEHLLKSVWLFEPVDRVEVISAQPRS